MARASNNKIKIGVHWKNTVSIEIPSSNSPRHPKLIELDPNIPLDDYISKICDDWKIPLSNSIHYALRYDDIHKFVIEQNRFQIPTGQVFYLSLSHENEVQDILKYLSSNDYQRYDSTILERLKLAGEDETFALEFVKQNGLQYLLKLFTDDGKLNNYENFTPNLLRSLHNVIINQRTISWDHLENIDKIIDQLICGINASKLFCRHSSVAMMILDSIISMESKYSLKIIQTLQISNLLDYCTKQHDIETQYYALALINIIMSKSDQTIRSSLVRAMSHTTVTTNLRELVQLIIIGDENSNNDSFTSTDTAIQSSRHLTRSSLIQQLCLLQRFYLNELYTNSMNTSPDRLDTKYRDMIAELRRSAFDTDLLLSDQSCQDLTTRLSSGNINESMTTSTFNPRRVEALQRDYERLGFQDLREPIKDFELIPPGILSLQSLFYFCIHQKNDFIRFVLENSCKTFQQQCPLVKSAIEITRILCRLFNIGIEPNRHQIHKDYFLLFYTITLFFEQAFARCLLLFNKTWKEMRACDVDFEVVSSVVYQQISQSLDDICLMNPSVNKTIIASYSPSKNQTIASPTTTKSTMNTSLTSVALQRFTFDYFSERLNANNYKDICRRRDEQELKREESIMRLPIVETLKERLRSHVQSLTRQARLKTMKKGQIFFTIESRSGAKKTKNRAMYWQLLDNEKHVQCSESPTTVMKENNTRDGSTTSLTRTTIPLENIKDVQCYIDQSRSGNLNNQERLPKIPRHSNANMSVTIVLQNDTTYTLLCENDYDMSCWSDGFNILFHKEMDSFYAREEMELLLNLLCQLQILELDNPSIILSQHSLPVPIRLPPTRPVSST
ncbi:unnamed protein product [Rotaria magnacalcarata]|uniref:ELMO domain-containing protein n=4 Tax=Rotaria magnacalcarata TaxID=392030 RepID=A0A819ISI7_9BILA|nr:unnamed protein product [Rotaria magnacalcarata]CAF3918269.1 unnamed protein product [Rotaria magnacalcarata]